MKAPKTVAFRVRSARAEAGLSVSDLAREAGLSVSGVGLIEAGTRKDLRLETVVSLARALNVSIDWLATGSGRGVVRSG